MRNLTQKADWDETRFLQEVKKYPALQILQLSLREWFVLRGEKIVGKYIKYLDFGWPQARKMNQIYLNALVELGRREGWLEGYEYARG